MNYQETNIDTLFHAIIGIEYSAMVLNFLLIDIRAILQGLAVAVLCTIVTRNKN